MLYDVTKIYVLNNEILYVDGGEISRDSANYNQIDVITNVSGFGVEIAFELPNGVYSDRLSLIQNTGTVTIPSSPSQLTPYEGEEWSSYSMLIPNAVLSAITSTTSQTLGFSLRFTKGVSNLLTFEDKDSFPSVGDPEKVYFDDELDDYWIWDGTAYVEKTSSEADDLIVAFDQVYTTERATLSVQGTIGGEPVALDSAWYQNQIVSELNTLISLYNQIFAAVSDPTTGLAQKVTKSGDTMTGSLSFSNANATRLVLGNNDVTMDDDAQINATSFSNGDYVSDAVKFSDLASLFDVTADTPGNGENWLTTYSDALEAKFDEFLTQATLGTAFLRTDGQNAMTGNLNMGGQEITNVGNVDGVDLSQLKTDFDAVAAFFEVGDQDNAINKMQDIIAVFDQYTETFDLATALGAKEDSANIGDRTYTNDHVVTDDETVTASIDALDTESQRLDNIKIDLDGENSSLTTLRYIHDDTDPQNIVYSSLTYDKDRQILQYATPDGTTLQVGGELWFVNAKTNDTLTHGDPVQFAGTQGDHFLVKKAVGSEIEANQDLFVGVATHDAVANDFVKITWFGEVDEVATGSWNVGDILYFDKATAGLTNTEPTTQPIIQVAAVTKVETAPGANNGRLLIRPQFISRKDIEVFVDAIEDGEGGNKLDAANLRATLETLYDKIQTHEDASNPHGISLGTIGAAAASHTHVIGDVTGLQTALSSKPTIDSETGKIPIDVIPFQFDDVLQYANVASFPQLGDEVEPEEGKLYIDISTNDIYRWNGVDAYVLVKEAVGALGDIPNVTLTSESTDDVLKYNGNQWVNGKLDINELTDVVITNVAEGEYLKYDPTANGNLGAWVNVELDVPTIDNLNAIADVNADTPSAGDILQYNASTSTWDLSRINFVSDTAPTNPELGDLWFDSTALILYIYYNDGDSNQWVNAAGGVLEAQVEVLNDVNDVNVPNPTDGQVLTYDDASSEWQAKDATSAEYYTLTIADTDWSGTDPTTAVKTVSGVLATDRPLIDLDLSAVAFADVETQQTEYAKLYRVSATADDEITFYALEAPTESLDILIKVVR